MPRTFISRLSLPLSFTWNVSAHGCLKTSHVCLNAPPIALLSTGLPHTDSQTACHRIFLATLIIAAKYLNDSCPKNIHWAKYTGYFGVFEITKAEVELLAVLDYDLRFDEAETCQHFAPFMRTRAQEKRAAAVSVVTKAGLARAQAQMPPTPPRERPSQSSSLSGVQGLVKRLSSVCLSSTTTACASPAQRNPSTSSSIQSTPSFSSDSSDVSSAADSDSEWPLLSDSVIDARVHGIERQQLPPTNFHLKPVPIHAYRRLRKDSATVSSPLDAEDVERPRPTNPASLTPSSTLSALTIRLVNAPEDTALDPEGSGYISGLPPRSVSWGSLLKNDTRGLTRTGTIHSRKEGGFLSRMWGVATRGIHDRTDKPDLLNRVDIVDSEAQEEYGTEVIRHVTRSRSAIIRAESQEYLV
jgi:G1/S-specific cyclin PLC1